MTKKKYPPVEASKIYRLFKGAPETKFPLYVYIIQADKWFSVDKTGAWREDTEYFLSSFITETTMEELEHWGLCGVNGVLSAYCNLETEIIRTAKKEAKRAEKLLIKMAKNLGVRE